MDVESRKKALRCLFQQVIDPLRSLPLNVVVDVAVDVGGRSQTRVTQDGLDDLQVHAFAQEEAGGGVPGCVQLQVPHAGPIEGLGPGPVDVARLERRPERRGEDDPRIDPDTGSEPLGGLAAPVRS